MSNEHSLLVKTRFFHLKLVLTIARLGTVHKAAEALSMTQPAATRALKELEYQLGAPLFDRSHQGMTLNLFGERFAAHARVLLNQLKAATDDLNEVMSGSFGHVNIGVLPAATPNLIPQTFTRLQQKQFQISITVEEGILSRLLPMLLDGTIDLLIGRLPPPPNDVELTQTALFYDSFVIVCGNNNPLLQRKRYKLKDLVNEKWIFPTPSTSRLMADVQETFNREKVQPPKPALEISALQAVRNILAETEMISILSAQVAMEEKRHGLLSILPVEFESVLTPIGITTRSQTEMAPAVHVVSDVVKEVSEELVQRASHGLRGIE